MAVSTPIAIGGAAAAALAAGAVINNAAKLFTDRYKALNMPTWEMQGQAKMWGQNGGTARYVRGQEALTKGMYEMPYELIKDRFITRGNQILDLPGAAYDRYKLGQKFEAIRNDPSVQAMGEAKARDLYMQVGKLAPDLVRKAPATAIPAIQNAILTDSAGLRADYVYNMARAQQAING